MVSTTERKEKVVLLILKGRKGVGVLLKAREGRSTAERKGGVLLKGRKGGSTAERKGRWECC